MIKNYFPDIHALISITFLLIANSAVATPSIQSVTGNITEGGTITISGSDFTTKTNAQPWFWWKADFGTASNSPSNLGRKTSWDSTVNGSISTSTVAPGSTQSIGFDHGVSSAAALGKVTFNSNRAYMFRETNEDFDYTQDYLTSTQISNLSGSINSGDTITGATSGATGVVASYYAGGNRIYYSATGGTINSGTPTNFIQNETLTSSNGASMTNAEYFGTFRTFNFKTTRWWNLANTSSIHVSAQGANPNPTFKLTVENPNNGFTSNLQQLPYVWKSEEVEFASSSSSGAQNGQWNFYQNGVLANGNSIITPTGANAITTIYQSQVSNGAQAGSIVYYDSLYIDDSWHRVVTCGESTWAECKEREIQIPTAWDNNSIDIQLNLGKFNSNQTMFLYVVDENGIANINGFNLCQNCPSPPQIIN